MNVLPLGVMMPPELTEMLRGCRPLKVVPVAVRVPPTAIWACCMSRNVTVSPLAKLSVPLSVSVWFDGIVTGTLAPTASVRPKRP